MNSLCDYKLTKNEPSLDFHGLWRIICYLVFCLVSPKFLTYILRSRQEKKIRILWSFMCFMTVFISRKVLSSRHLARLCYLSAWTSNKQTKVNLHRIDPLISASPKPILPSVFSLSGLGNSLLLVAHFTHFPHPLHPQDSQLSPKLISWADHFYCLMSLYYHPNKAFLYFS